MQKTQSKCLKLFFWNGFHENIARSMPSLISTGNFLLQDELRKSINWIPWNVLQFKTGHLVWQVTLTLASSSSCLNIPYTVWYQDFTTWKGQVRVLDMALSQEFLFPCKKMNCEISGAELELFFCHATSSKWVLPESFQSKILLVEWHNRHMAE